MKESMKVNVYVVMELVGLALVIFAGRLFDREYFIGIMHGIGCLIFIYGIVAGIVNNIKSRKEVVENKEAD